MVLHVEVALAICIACVAAAENHLPRRKRGWETTPPPQPQRPQPPPSPPPGWGWSPPHTQGWSSRPTQPPYGGWGPPPTTIGWGWGWNSNNYYPDNILRPRPYYGRRYSRYSTFPRTPDYYQRRGYLL